MLGPMAQADEPVARLSSVADFDVPALNENLLEAASLILSRIFGQ